MHLASHQLSGMDGQRGDAMQSPIGGMDLFVLIAKGMSASFVKRCLDING